MKNATVSNIADRVKRDEATREISPAIAAALAELFTFYRQPLTSPDTRQYARVLRGVGGLVLQSLLDEVMDTREFLPKPPELGQDLARVATRVRDANPFEPCITCKQNPGWIEVLDETAAPRFRVRYTNELYFTFQAEPRWRSKIVVDANGAPVLDPLPPPTRLARCVCYRHWHEQLGLGPVSTPRPTLQLDEARDDTGPTNIGSLVKRFKERLDVERK